MRVRPLRARVLDQPRRIEVLQMPRTYPRRHEHRG